MGGSIFHPIVARLCFIVDLLMQRKFWSREPNKSKLENMK